MPRLGQGSRRRRGNQLNADVNIINLVDVMLVLLIIFMVTAPIMQGGITVRLPKAASKPLQVTDALNVTVDRAGRVAIGEQRYTWSEFETAFPVLAKTRHPSGVFLHGDAGASFGDIARVLGLIQAAGIEKVGLVTEAPHP